MKTERIKNTVNYDIEMRCGRNAASLHSINELGSIN